MRHHSVTSPGTTRGLMQVGGCGRGGSEAMVFLLGYSCCGVADVWDGVRVIPLSFPRVSTGSVMEDNYFHAACSTSVPALLKLISLPLYLIRSRGGG